jgi:hypothetical protein
MARSPSSLRKGNVGAYNKKPRQSLIVLSLRAEARRMLSHQAAAKLLCTSTDQLKNSEPDHAPGAAATPHERTTRPIEESQ